MSSKQKIPTDPLYSLKTGLAGGVAGICAKTAVAPLERLRILFQAQHSNYRQHGIITGLVDIFKKERIFGLYKGNTATIIRQFPYQAIEFLSYDFYNKCLSASFPAVDSNPKNKQHSLKFIAGSSAGLTASCITYPLDLIRARMAFHVAGASVTATTGNGGVQLAAHRPSYIKTISGIMRNEGGILAFYRGISANIIGVIPLKGIYFYTFERLKHFALHTFPNVCSKKSKDGEVVLNIPSKLVCGAAAGAAGNTVMYPIDLTRRRMQLAYAGGGSKAHADGVLKSLMLTYKEHGIVKGLYRGLSLGYIRACPYVAVNFCTYELMRQLLHLDSGLGKL